MLLTLLLLFSGLLHAQGQIQTRKQQLEILRRDKVARLWPERQSQIVDLVNKYTEQGFLDDPSQGSNGFQPIVLGGMRSDNGFTYGIGYRRSDLFRDRLGVRATARGSLAKSTLFDLSVNSPRLNSGRAFVDFYAKYENSPTMSYYGQGQDSLEENQTSYRLEDTDLGVTGGFRLTDWLKVSGRAGGYFVHTGEGTREPSIDTLFPGLRQNVDYFRWDWAAQADYRDNPSAPRFWRQLLPAVQSVPRRNQKSAQLQSNPRFCRTVFSLPQQVTGGGAARRRDDGVFPHRPVDTLLSSNLSGRKQPLARFSTLPVHRSDGLFRGSRAPLVRLLGTGGRCLRRNW